MRDFEHLDATSLDEAVSVLSEYAGDASVIAGGTDLLGTLKEATNPVYPRALLNIKGIPDLAYIEEDSEGLRVGALTRLHEVETNQRIRERYGLLADAARAVGSPQIRRMATIGGNICQEPRCWYYRYPDNLFHCTRKDGGICNALTGENRYHSIFGAVRVAETPCSAGCPARVDIPSYMGKIREGDLSGAAGILLEANPLPSITGRVCPHFCEEACNRGEYDEAVSVRSVERFLGDHILNNASEILKPPQVETGRTVAVVGAGPAGLSAAYYLRTLGHRVTVFDRMPEAGGMLAYAIPSYRLPKDVVKRAVRTIEQLGVEFRLGVDVGKELKLEALRQDFDSVFLAPGAWRQPSIGLEGEELTRSGLEFLVNVNRGVKEVPGQRVLVIGGGSVAVDVGITALRLGSEEVTLACLECREEMPAYEEEIQQTLEEGVRLMPSWGPVKVLETGDKAKTVELVRCTSVFDENACFAPSFDESIRETVEVDQVMMAVGQRTDVSFLGPESPLQLDEGLIVVDPDTQETNVPGVFAGGDVTSGRGTVVEAIACGRRAAFSISRYLGGADAHGEHNEQEAGKPLLKFNSAYLRRTARVEIPKLPIGQRGIHGEDTLGLHTAEAEEEASRCFNCGCVAVSPSDVAPALVALGAKIETTKRTIAAEEFFTVGPMRSTILDHEELVTGIQIPAPKPDSRQVFLKFRLRNSIDFPIVAVAAMVAKDEGEEVSEARIALGAVAPIPLRAREAEEYLKGKEISEEVAEEAAAIAVREAIPLAENGYKVQITRALVRRAVLAAA
jgi:NADPH-dependent glutamate synthase beta subunit-like oxidoreductase/CO/xanthine dehydrogenase FAD-binding subunit